MTEHEEVPRTEFYTEMTEPDAPNKFALQLEADESFGPNRSFSKNGIEDIMREINTFILSRIIGNWRRMGVAPHKMRVELTLHFDGDKTLSLPIGAFGPHFTLIDTKGLTDDDQGVTV